MSGTDFILAVLLAAAVGIALGYALAGHASGEAGRLLALRRVSGPRTRRWRSSCP